MRGPGPKWRAKHAPASRDSEPDLGGMAKDRGLGPVSRLRRIQGISSFSTYLTCSGRPSAIGRCAWPYLLAHQVASQLRRNRSSAEADDYLIRPNPADPRLTERVSGVDQTGAPVTTSVTVERR